MAWDYMTKLKELDASVDCGINDEGIANLNLEKLNASDNFKITNVNHMIKLKVLNASVKCGIDDE